MCNKKLQIHLCTCKKNENRSVKVVESLSITWHLYRFVKNKWLGIDGMLIEPVDSFKNIISAEFLCHQLNTIRNACFDFEYIPAHGDIIYFYLKKSSKDKVKNINDSLYISLIFRNDLWQIENYDPYYVELKELNKGDLIIKNEAN